MNKHFSVAVTIMLLSGCGAVCENEVYQTALSPSGKMKAVVFNQGCGATVGFNTQVSVIPANTDLPAGGGNALIVDDTVSLKLNWESDEALRIEGQLDTQIFKQETSVEGVRLSYAK